MSRKLVCAFLAVMLLISSLTGCGKAAASGNFTIYFRDQSRAELVAVTTDLPTNGDPEALVSSVWSRMCDSSEGSGYVSVVPAGLTIKSFSLDGNNLVLNFGKEYPKVNTPDEVLLRAAVVKTFSQLDVVSSVEFLVDSQMLTDVDGNVLGPQKRMHYVDVMEQGLNDYTFTPVTLYFANETGDRLVPVRDEITHKDDALLAQHVVARLIVGSSSAEGYRVLPADTKIISVTVKDVICYVNLNNALEQVEFTVAPEIIIYSIVNSLTELQGISAVSVSINGSSGMFMDSIDLSKPLSRNLDYVDNTPAETESAE